MPLMKGFKPEVVSGNIKELVRSGRKPKQAVAIALAHKRKFKKMSEDEASQMMADGGEIKKKTGYEDAAKGLLQPKDRAAQIAAGMNKVFYQGGVVEGEEPDLEMDKNEGDHNRGDDLGMPGRPVYEMGQDSEGLSDSVMLAQALNRDLQKSKYAANQNSHDFDPNDPVAGQKMAKGGLVESGPEGDSLVGNKPELEWVDDGSAEPMSSEDKNNGHDAPMHASRAGSPLEHSQMSDPSGMGLSEEAKGALERKKKARRYGMYDPR